ncbi:hypothetical protein [Pseudomonas abieticivorans]|uniref:hypothetical protein n=1 Tax=Pseudomonas abieticivorans TaxID=2931382 RepID=UPI0020BE1308|nr:hypothetical protein [Pseudomonas sp. PIA16]
MDTDLSLGSQIAAHSTLASAVARQFASRPSLYGSAARLLGAQMREYYGNLDFKPEQTWLAVPDQDPVSGKTLGYSLSPVVPLLIDLYLSDRTLNLEQGFHFLTSDQQAPVAATLNVRMFTFELLVNEAAGLLLTAFMDDLKDYWNVVFIDGGSRWAWLSRFLHLEFERQVTIAAVTVTLDAEPLATGLALDASPQWADRQDADPDHPVKAWLLNVDSMAGDAALTSMLTPMLVISRHFAESNSDVYLCYLPFSPLQAYAGLQAMAEGLGAQLGRELTGERLELSLLPLAAHAFDAQAQAFLEQQLHLVAALGPACRLLGGDASMLAGAINDVTAFKGFEAPRQQAGLSRLEAALPPWLAKATGPDRQAYAEHIGKLAVATRRAGGRTFLNGVPSLEAFAAKALIERMASDHPGEAVPALADIEVHVVTVPNALLTIVNAGDAVMQDVQVSLVDFALFQQAGRPRGHLVVHPRAGAHLPAWVDAASVVQLIEHVDAGQQYMQLLKATLVNGPDVADRQQLFAAQLVQQLPLLALENVLKGEHGFTRAGYLLVADLMETARLASVARSRIRRLAIKARDGDTADGVSNMYVIDHPGLASGPCVLYRPLFRQPLREFANAAALFNAICDAGELQTAVLAWMSPQARARFGQGGFTEPHVLRFGAGSDSAPLSRPLPARLDCQAFDDPLLPALYQANVQALIEIADRQSISAEHSRWLAYGELAWVLFNALLPLASGALASAGWLVQTLATLDQQLAANPQGDVQKSHEALAELMFNIALFLLGEGLGLVTGADTALGRREALVSVNEALPRLQAKALLHPAPTLGAVASALPTQLDFRFANANRQFTAAQRTFIATLRVKPAEPLGGAVPRGPEQGLHWQGGQLLARVADDFYSVVADDGAAQVLDPLTGARSGPWLRRDELGRWQWDSRLRLAGGGPAKRRLQARAENEAAESAARLVLADYSVRYPPLFERCASLGHQLDEAAANNPAQLPALREEYLVQAQSLIELMDQAQVARERVNRRTVMPHFNELGAAGYAAMIEYAANIGSVLLAKLRTLVAANPLFLTVPKLAEVKALAAGDTLVVGQVLALLERHLGWRERIDGWRTALLGIPGHGPRALVRMDVMLQRHKSFMAVASALLQMHLFRGLTAFVHDPLTYKRLVAIMKPAHLAVISHAQLHEPAQALSLESQLEVLNSALDSYAQAQDGAQMLRDEVLDDAWEAFEPFLALLQRVADRAALEMAEGVREQASQAEADRPPVASTSNRVVMRLRNRRVLIGRRKAGQVAGEREVVEVANALDDKVVAAFEQAPDGQWGEVPTPAVAPPPVPVLWPALNTVLGKADTLLALAAPAIARSRDHARRALRPVEVQEDLQRQASQLAAAGDGIQALLEAENAVPLPNRRRLAQARLAKVRETVAQMLEQGRLMRVARTQELAPQVFHVHYLLEQQAVTIEPLNDRVFLEGPRGRKDYVDEYAIKDTQGKVLWYAHFHYPGKQTPAANFTAAHLKWAAQRKVGLQKQIAQARDNQEVTAIWRAAIGAQDARELFLSRRKGRQ